ncbi:unnamed protein product [Rotaria socialis]|uniref:Uncharacterized protein n=1 Tax=Rotaria socialis TaxID=392032 RepID=A0A817V728_9BILA|nr:unnamed protein product [Rotaria socialis]CAF3342674.1 unnamed protein product [Rotaria socialis]CAF3497827.1 unnamed protein product [Rotaria socialis]CAF3593170.1 unnamed protein product [Rotaria socialis]CAF4222726.1 unnamed protein product [Rotaria socialis]
MGTSSSSIHHKEQSNIDAHEQFHFRFTDCSCKCDANKRRVGDIYEQNDSPQAAFLTALITQISRPQYDINCNCDCGEGVKFGFLFGNTSSNTQEQTINDHSQ